MTDPAFPPFPAPLDTLDPRVASLVRGLIERPHRRKSHTAWNLAVAVGASWRLKEHPEGYKAALMAAVKSGNIPDSLMPERAWAHKLSRQAVAYLESFGLNTITILHEKLNTMFTLLPDVNTGDLLAHHWRGYILSLCHDREELEGVALVLQAAGSGVLCAALRQFDDRARLVACGRWREPSDDWILLRVRDKCSLVLREHWWTRPVDDYREPPPSGWLEPPF